MGSQPDQHEVWEAIAHSFDRTRDRTWAHVTEFIAAQPAGRMLDLMCGNGRHARPARAAGHDAVCFDWARPLVAAAHERHGGGVIGDATRLPFLDDSFDSCVYVAGLHGIPDPAGRANSLHELARVLKPGARAQITVWSRDAPRFRDEGKPGQPTDVVIPWRSDGMDAKRTYHLTTLPVFEGECATAGLVVESSGEVAIAAPEPDNLWVIVRPA